VRLSARVDYALRAMSELAAADAPRTVDQLSAAQHIPNKYLESILGELRRGGLLRSQRGPEGGYRLARAADAISIADVIRALDGELANVRGSRPENLEYTGSADPRGRLPRPRRARRDARAGRRPRRRPGRLELASTV
jgi:Rrf2 family protein